MNKIVAMIPGDGWMVRCHVTDSDGEPSGEFLDVPVIAWAIDAGGDLQPVLFEGHGVMAPGWPGNMDRPWHRELARHPEDRPRVRVVG